MRADAVIFGSPTRFGSLAAPLRAFLDSLGGLWSQGKLADKVYAGFTSTNDRARRAGDPRCSTLYVTLMHWGGIIVPPGYTDPLKFVDGNPYGAGLIANHDNISEFDDATYDALDHLARRVVGVAATRPGRESTPRARPAPSLPLLTSGRMWASAPNRVCPHNCQV